MPYCFAAAQITASRGDIAANLETHRHAMEMAAREGVDLLVFPELSVTGYEMDLAADLQTTPQASAFAFLHALARDAGMIALLGMPLKADGGKPYLGAIILGTEEPLGYAKMHVHTSEDLYFQSGTRHRIIPHRGKQIGCGICADLTHASHAAGARTEGADVYAVGALINEAAWTREEPMLRGYAERHDMAVVFSNYATKSGPYVPVGKSSVWAPGGHLITQATDTEECLVIARQTGDDWQGKTVAL